MPIRGGLVTASMLSDRDKPGCQTCLLLGLEKALAFRERAHIAQVLREGIVGVEVVGTAAISDVHSNCTARVVPSDRVRRI